MIEKDINIQENFLEEEEVFVNLRDTITQFNFDWHFSPIVVFLSEEQTSPGLLTHVVFDHNPLRIDDFMYNALFPMLDQLNIGVLLRIIINLSLRFPEPCFDQFHSDLATNLGEDMESDWTTSIFYMNTNNGYTELEDGTRIESVANRLVTFPANTKHRGVSQTDEQTRIVININYLKKQEWMKIQ